MKAQKILMAAALFSFAAAGNALAFHDGGVATCDSCHTMHNSKGNVKMSKGSVGSQFNAPNFLLQGSDQSSTCLNCHGQPDTAPTSYHIATYPIPAAGTAPVEMTPGGDFAWLQKSYTWTGGASNGSDHGHNIKAADFGFVPKTGKVAPGGTYPADNLACSSCHDPHGKYRQSGDPTNPTIGLTGGPIASSGSYTSDKTNLSVLSTGNAVGVYRLLGGVGYQPASLTGSYQFASASPSAIAPSTYNRNEATADTRVAYGQGMSEWCANCHTQIHSDVVEGATVSGLTIHPAGNGAKLTAAVAANYNNYVASGNLTGTFPAGTIAYSSLVPVEEGTNNLTTLQGDANITNATGKTAVSTSANVMCLSCHRAHASGWDQAARWNNGYEMLVVNSQYPGTDATDPGANSARAAQGRTQAETQAAYYGRPVTAFATYQRSLCNKCHAKD